MPKCVRIFNLFGMKHIQALILGFSNSTNTINFFAMKHLLGRSSDTGNIPQNIATPGNNLVERFHYLPIALGRIVVAFFLLRLNNKYILLVFAILELVSSLLVHTIYTVYGVETLQWGYLALAFIQGASWPLSLHIISKWSTTTTMTFMLWLFFGTTFIFNGIYFVFLSRLDPIDAVHASIYLTVAVKSIFSILWVVFGSGDPIHNIFTSKEELAELREEHRLRMRCHWKQGIPVKQMLKTPIIYGSLVFQCAARWMHTWDYNPFVEPFVWYITNGTVLAIVGYFMKTITAGIVALSVDFLIKKNKTTINNIRKTLAAVTGWGCGCCFLLLGATLGRDSRTFAFIVLNQLFRIPNYYYGVILILHNISPNYLGVTYSLTSAIAYLSLGFKPFVDAILAEDAVKDPTRAMSRLLYFYGCFHYFGCLTMLLSGTCRRRSYDNYDTVPWKEDSIVSFP